MSHSEITLQPSAWQWSIRDLLLWMLYLAIYSAMVGYIGIETQIFWVCSVYAGILTIVFAFAVPRQSISLPIIAIFIGIFFLVNPIFFFISQATFINCCLHGAVLLPFCFVETPLSAKRVIEISIATTLVSFTLAILIGASQYSELLRVRKQTAAEDLAPRLAYETRLDAAPRSKLVKDDFDNSRWPSFEAGLLESIGDEASWNGRQWELERLHQRYVETFIKSQGFGVGRFMFSATPGELSTLPANFDIPFSNSYDGSILEDRWPLMSPWPVDSRVDLANFHFAGVRDFLQPETFGLVLEPKVVRGFQSHAFHFQPKFSTGDEFGSVHKLTRLQLISLAKYDTPRAYVLDHLPRMDQLNSDNAPTRTLTRYEAVSLERIRNGQEILSQRDQYGVDTVGAIRAVKSCLDCHTAQRGELLGAFSYRFDLQQTIGE